MDGRAGFSLDDGTIGTDRGIPARALLPSVNDPLTGRSEDGSFAEVAERGQIVY